VNDGASTHTNSGAKYNPITVITTSGITTERRMDNNIIIDFGCLIKNM
jgi:hypothetical protein